MLTTNILLAEKYDYLSEKFKKAFTFLRDTDLAALPVGNVPIDGNEVYANVQSYSTMDAADCPFQMAVRIGISKDISRIFINEIWIFFQDSPNPFPKFSLCR